MLESFCILVTRFKLNVKTKLSFKVVNVIFMYLRLNLSFNLKVWTAERRQGRCCGLPQKNITAKNRSGKKITIIYIYFKQSLWYKIVKYFSVMICFWVSLTYKKIIYINSWVTLTTWKRASNNFLLTDFRLKWNVFMHFYSIKKWNYYITPLTLICLQINF